MFVELCQTDIFPEYLIKGRNMLILARYRLRNKFVEKEKYVDSVVNIDNMQNSWNSWKAIKNDGTRLTCLNG